MDGAWEPGIYGVRINPFDSRSFFRGMVLDEYFMVIELGGRAIIVSLSDESKSIFERSMRKSLEEITDEDGFTVHKDGSVTSTRGQLFF